MLCAWCDRVRSPAGEWEERDRKSLDIEEATHGICPDCLAQETRAACSVPDCR